ncbi:hypothetical protein [Bacillus albus]|uniref:hypothetical protein n=1 Tax=Bacillus albus TaxID=2026189 RepID=UPI0014197501|nr:hypothetical protein [Bacillus albus]
MDLSQKEDRDRLYDHHKHNLVYIGDYIKFADTKAGVGLGAALVMLGFFGNEAKNIKFSSLSFWDYSLLVGLSPLIVTCYFFIWKVLWPRYTTDITLYMSWGGIGSFPNTQAYVSHIEQVEDAELIHAMGNQNYSLAQVCIKKYLNLKYGFISLTIGAVIETVSWFFSK